MSLSLEVKTKGKNSIKFSAFLDRHPNGDLKILP